MSLLSRSVASLIPGMGARPALVATAVPVRNHTGYIPFEGRPGDIDTENRRFNTQVSLDHIFYTMAYGLLWPLWVLVGCTPIGTSVFFL